VISVSPLLNTPFLSSPENEEKSPLTVSSEADNITAPTKPFFSIKLVVKDST
jgi:hypothetical protein